MATIDTLLSRGSLVKIAVPLARREFENRSIYGVPDFITWMGKNVPHMKTGRLQATNTPSEQLDDILRRWITGKPLRYGNVVKDLMPAADEVWELKTADLRIFGWIYQPRKYIAVLGAYADDYKGPHSPKHYKTARSHIMAVRRAIDLDEPKFATGKYDELV
jgi:hypothetical protein